MNGVDYWNFRAQYSRNSLLIHQLSSKKIPGDALSLVVGQKCRLFLLYVSPSSTASIHSLKMEKLARDYVVYLGLILQWEKDSLVTWTCWPKGKGREKFHKKAFS